MIRPILFKLFTVILISALTNSERSSNRVDDPNSVVDSSYQNPKNQAYYQYPFPYAFDSVTTERSLYQHHSTETARDSYMDAAAGLGYGGSSVSGEPASAYQYQIYQKDGGQGDYGSEDTGVESGGGILGVVLGLLGLKGLKALGIIKFFKLFPIFAPIILPILPIILLLLSPLLLLLAPFLFILKLPLFFILGLPLLPLLILALPLLAILPVPVISIRSLPGLQRINLLESILYRDDCVERISCEVSRIVSSNGFSAPWMRNIIEKSPPNPRWIHRIARAIESPDCKEYKCGAVNSMQATFNLATN